jgi:hypothetical protein
VLGVEVVQVKGGHFRGPCAGIVEKMKEGVITETFFSFKIEGVKEAEDLLRIKESDEGFLSSFLWD